MVFVADALGAWLVEQLADAGRRKLTELLLGTDQERALRQAAGAAVTATAAELTPPGGQQADQIAMVISEVFRDPAPAALAAGPTMLLEGIQAGITAQLAVLDDPALTGTGHSSADLLGVTGAALADRLTTHLIREVITRGSTGGPLTPLSSQLNHELTRLQGQRIEATLARLATDVRAALLTAGSTPATPERPLQEATDPVAASPAYRASWDVLESLEDSLNSRTPRILAAHRPGMTAGPRRFTLDRASIHTALVDAMSAAGRSAGQLIVRGEPGTGKSAAVLSAVEEIRRAGGTVVALSLRDLPPGPAAVAAQVLQALPRAVLAATAAAPVRLLVLDGAEAAQEAGPVLLHDLARAASRAGLGLVAVTRDDARETVGGTLAEALAAGTAEPSPDPTEVEVPPLGEAEVAKICETFPELGRLTAAERPSWLLRRVGVIGVLLRGDAVAGLPDGTLSEAGVLDAVWSAWVRNREQPLPGGATPDGRDEALTGLARRQLAGGSVPGPLTADPRALASMRSDGLLLPAGKRFAFRPGDDFSNDMVRDFALAVVFARDGFGVLKEAGAPRWALRAARMACQGMLAGLGPGVAGRMRDLQQQFDVISAMSGDRWADLPWEAALTSDAAESVLRECAGDLLRPGGALLDRVVRLVVQRFSGNGAADPVIAAPVVGFLVERADEAGKVRYRFAEEAAKLIVSWLCAVRRAEMSGVDVSRWRPLRVRVRDCLLRPGRGDHQVEAQCLALLGSDTDARVTGFLRGLALRRAHRLAECIELFDPVMSLAETDADLLFELTEAYYVEGPEVSGWGLPGRGIRRHKHTHPGFGHPFADWRYGPFWRLLSADLPRALALINRMLDHAVTCRLGPGRRAGDPSGQPGGGEPGGGALPGIQLDIPGIGSRHYAGDGQVWGWYRGTGTGPYPCMSALLAAERIADEWLRQGTPLPALVTALLRDAHNLAMPGLVVGVLTRHAELVAGEADQFLASPDVWELESARAVMETGIHAQLRDDPETPGRGRRSWTMADLAGCLVFSAVSRGDRERADALRAAGRTLAASAAEAAGRAADREDGVPDGGPGPAAAGAGQGGKLTVVARLWASKLDASNYTASRDGDGNIAWEWQPPSDIEAAMAPDRSEQERRGEVYRLVNVYSLRPDPPCLWAAPPVPAPDVLAADARTARSFAGRPPGPGAAPFEAATAVAAVLLRAAAGQPGQASRDDLEWAAVTVAGALTRPLEAPGASSGSVFADGADLSAASAAALLLMPALTEPAGELALLDEEDVAAVAEILAGAAASPFTRVRMILARNLGPVWAAPCGPRPGGGERCRHVIAWAAVEAGARDVAMDPWDNAGRRGRRRLNGPLAEALAACPAGDLMLDLLAPPLVAACGAAGGGSCIAPAARELRDALLGAYTRTAVVWGEESYDSPDEDQYAVAESLLAAGTREPGLLTTAVSALAGQARALSEALRAMTVAATYSATARASLARAWPDIMTAVLDAADAGAGGLADRDWGGRAIAELIPSPSAAGWDADVDAVLRAARDGWPAPAEVSSQVARLLPRAAGHWGAADHLIGLLGTVPPAEQARIGLPWVHQVITGRRAPGWPTFRSVEWLRSLREENAVNDQAWPLYNAILDALAAEDYRGAVALQQQGE